mgnify:CR=1 FL=1
MHGKKKSKKRKYKKKNNRFEKGCKLTDIQFKFILNAEIIDNPEKKD